MEILPQRLKQVRERRGLTQRELAAILNVSPSTIALYETGDRKPDPAMLRKLADVLGCTTDFLLGRVDEDLKYNGILAAHRSDDDPMTDLPEEAIKELEAFEEFIRHKYKNYKSPRKRGSNQND